MNKKQYWKETEYTGSYPAVLVTDGNHYDVLFHEHYDQDERAAGWFRLMKLHCSDCLPNLRNAEMMRKFVKKFSVCWKEEYMRFEESEL